MSKIVKTEAEWRAELPDLAYRVLREHATERPFSHDNFPDSAGTYHCKGCGAPLFVAQAKFDAGCGWPSFDAPLDEGVIETSTDQSHGMLRTEVHCARCDGHLGHVFPDGPTETGLRFCINGVAIDFNAEDQP